MFELSSELITKAAGLFRDHPRYGVGEEAVISVFKTYRGNSELRNVLIKASVLNYSYSTNIFNLAGISKHITGIPGIDQRLTEGDICVVQSVRLGHGITTRSGKDYDFYSFATKFCSFENPESYPIFDNLVLDFLYRYNGKYKWLQRIVETHMANYSEYKTHMADYSEYRKLIDTVRSSFGIDSYKVFDQGVWVLAKYLSRGKEKVYDPWIEKEVGTLINSM